MARLGQARSERLGRDPVIELSGRSFNTDLESYDEPSDPYSATPEIVPDTPKSPSGELLSGKDEDNVKGELRIDGAAYNRLTKPDPNFATTFYHADVRGERWESDFLKLDKESYFRMLGEIHRGEKNGPKWEHSELTTHSLREDLVDIIGKKLNLTDLQLEEAKARATNVDGEKFGRTLELLAFCVCGYVVHRDESTPAVIKRDFHPNCSETDLLFEKVAEELGLGEREIDDVCRSLDQKFSEPVPPRGFDRRKPGWEPNCSE